MMKLHENRYFSIMVPSTGVCMAGNGFNEHPNLKKAYGARGIRLIGWVSNQRPDGRWRLGCHVVLIIAARLLLTTGLSIPRCRAFDI